MFARWRCCNIQSALAWSHNQQVQGPHIVTAMELCCTNLHTVLQQHDSPLLPSIIKRLVSDVLKGVQAMHSHGAHCSAPSLPQQHLELAHIDSATFAMDAVNLLVPLPTCSSWSLEGLASRSPQTVTGGVQASSIGISSPAT